MVQAAKANPQKSDKWPAAAASGVNSHFIEIPLVLDLDFLHFHLEFHKEEMFLLVLATTQNEQPLCVCLSSGDLPVYSSSLL